MNPQSTDIPVAAVGDRIYSNKVGLHSPLYVIIWASREDEVLDISMPSQMFYHSLKLDVIQCSRTILNSWRENEEPFFE